MTSNAITKHFKLKCEKISGYITPNIRFEKLINLNYNVDVLSA